MMYNIIVLSLIISTAYADETCFSTSVSPKCDNVDCVRDVCDIDEWCCNVNWDGICVGIANNLCKICNDQSENLIPNPYDETKYFKCDYNHDKRYSYDCPDGLVFNPEIGLCDWRQTNPDIFCTDHMYGLPFPNEDCSKYNVCDQIGQVHTFECQSGLKFNPELKYCDWANNVNCEEDCISDFNIELVNIGSNSDYDDLLLKVVKKWQCIITGDLPDVPDGSGPPNWFGNDPYVHTGSVDDLVIGYKFDDIDGPFNILGYAGPIYLRSGSNLPISGIMVFDSVDLQLMIDDGTLEGVMLHEMGHILGMVGILGNGLTDCPTTSTYFGTLAQNAYNALGFVGGLKVELDFGPGSQCAHWNENTESEQGLGNELMTPTVDLVMPLSDITISHLEDLGYTVDHSKAEPFGPGNANDRRRSISKPIRYDLKNDNACNFGYCPIILEN